MNRNPVKSIGLMIALAAGLVAPGIITAQEADDAKDQLQEMIQSGSYGVPSSPAFELLPGKPSEVVHTGTPHDVSSNLLGLLDGTRLRSGAAFDIRPAAPLAGSLANYQNGEWWSQAAWRTVLAVGTASASDIDGDVLLSAGVRIPLIDEGDPRADKNYTNMLQKKFVDALNVQPDIDDPDATINKMTQEATKNLDPIREKWVRDHWNAFRLNIGFAGMLRAKSGELKADSLSGESLGAWAATSFGLGNWSEVTASLKYTATATDDTAKETGRFAIGGRARFFIGGGFAFSGEGAYLKSMYSNNSALDASWTHLALVAELKIPYIGGWLGLGYGGDVGDGGDSKGKFSLRYAIYRDPLITR